MSYIGNTPTSIPFITDTFSGNASATSFTPLTRAPASTASIAVFISGTYQPPSAYTLSGVTITFVTPPPNAAGNIVVLHLGTGSATQVPSDGSVTLSKLYSDTYGYINAAFTTANTPSYVANSAASYANSSFSTANSSASYANSGFAVANSSALYANSGFAVANSAATYANGAFTTANSRVNTANTNTFTATQIFNGSSSVVALKTNNIVELANVTATAASSTVNFDITTQSVLYYTSNATGNFTVNFRGSSGTAANTIMSTGESLSVTFLVTNGTTAYYNSAVTVDGNSVTPKWQGGTAPTSGNASSVDSYTYVIIKTGSAAFTVLASQTKFA